MNTTNTNTKRVSLSSVVSSILKNAGTSGVSVSKAVEVATTVAAEHNLTIKINYRSVYQQLKTLGSPSSKGHFVDKQYTVETKEVVAVAA